MFLTSRSCYKNGVSFVHVHDCFWTHAADVDRMNEICREQFLELHNLPLLEDLAEFISTNLVPKITDEKIKSKLISHLNKIPQRGDLDLEQVKKSIFFFS